MHTMKHYSVTKRNEFESVLVRWTNIQPVTQSDVSWKEEDEYQ